MKVSIENAIEELPQMFNFNTKHITESQAKLFREKADNSKGTGGAF